MQDVVVVACPYCFESLELCLDPDTLGSFVQDCDVCCRPWQVVVTRDADGDLSARVERSD